jgi:hypothetical protein
MGAMPSTVAAQIIRGASATSKTAWDGPKRRRPEDAE